MTTISVRPDAEADGTAEATDTTASGSLLPGLAVVAVLAVIATLLGRLEPVIGAPVIGVVLGVAVSAWARRRARVQRGIAFAGRTLLQIAVVLLGAQLSLAQVARIGVTSLPVMVGTLATCFTLAHFVGRRLGVERDLRILIGAGTGICGASAIAAVTPVIRAKNPAVAYAMSTIFLFNVLAVLTFPAIGHWLGLSQHEFGLFAGTAVNDTSSVVAAATSFGTTAAHDAVVVKLTRSLMIIPVCLGLAAWMRRRDARERSAVLDPGPWPARVAKLVPPFLIGFVLLAAVNSLGWVPSGLHGGLATGTVFLITMALVGIGAGTDLPALRRTGMRPVLLGLLLWVAVSAVSLALLTITT